MNNYLFSISTILISLILMPVLALSGYGEGYPFEGTYQEDDYATNESKQKEIEHAHKIKHSHKIDEMKGDIVTCPVMGSKVHKSNAVDKVEYKGETYYFCCQGCKPEFMKNPEKYNKK